MKGPQHLELTPTDAALWGLWFNMRACLETAYQCPGVLYADSLSE